MLFFGARRRPTRRGRAGQSRQKKARGSDPFGAGFEGLIPNLRRRYEAGHLARTGGARAVPLAAPVPVLRGERLKAQSLAVSVKGRTISEYVDLPISEAVTVFDALELTDRESADRRAASCARSATACTSWTTSASAT